MGNIGQWFPASNESHAIPSVTFGGNVQNSINPNPGNIPYTNENPVFAWTDNFSILVGKHAMKFGAYIERMKFSAWVVLVSAWTLLVYSPMAHWVWGGGWLAQLGANYRLGRGFIDTGGASTIQAVGGVTALAITCILGPRRGKYDGSGPPGAIPGHSVVLCLFGCVLAWIGWIGLNAAGALLFVPGVAFADAGESALSAAIGGGAQTSEAPLTPDQLHTCAWPTISATVPTATRSNHSDTFRPAIGLVCRSASAILNASPTPARFLSMYSSRQSSCQRMSHQQRHQLLFHRPPCLFRKPMLHPG